jgi:hypothetical protein
VQQESAPPFEPPRSHCSLTDESTTLFPQSDVKVTVTK